MPTNTPQKLTVDPDLAASIGVDAALLMQQLNSHVGDRQLKPQHNTRQQVPLQWLKDTFRFWNEEKLAATADLLEKQGLVHFHEWGEVISFTQAINLNASATKTSTRTREKAKNNNVAANHNLGHNQAKKITADWQCDPQTMQLLMRQHNLSEAQVHTMCESFKHYWLSCNTKKTSWQRTFINHAARLAQRQPSAAVNTTVNTTLGADWQPDVLTQRELKQANIDDQFIKEATLSFVRYWREYKPNAGMWNQRFVEHCKREWSSKYPQAAIPGYQPIPTQWQPDNNLYALLKNNGITKAFAQNLISEFIIYWQKRGTALKHWDKCFFNHATRSWQYAQNNGGSSQKTAHANNSWDNFISRHSDPQWRDD